MLSSVFTIARYSLLEAVRGKVLWIVISLLILSVLISLFISQTALTETRESQVALMAGFLRLSSVFVMIFFVVSSVAREFQDKAIELIFSIAMPRYQIFIGKFLGFSLIAFVIIILYSMLLLFYSDALSVLIWSLSFWCELSLVALLSLILILSLENVALSLISSIGAYALMRFMPAIQSMGDGPFQDGLFNKFINVFLDLISLLMPRLDNFSQSSWLAVSPPTSTEVISFVIEFVLFVILFSLVGIIDLKRKTI